MLSRIIKTENEILLLYKDGTYEKATDGILTDFLINFKTAEHFSGTDGAWILDCSDMALYPGETLAYVADNNSLVVFKEELFSPIISGKYEIEGYIGVAEYARKHNRSNASIKTLCREGRITGAYKVGSRWMIPENTPYPVPPARRRK